MARGREEGWKLDLIEDVGYIMGETERMAQDWRRCKDDGGGLWTGRLSK